MEPITKEELEKAGITVKQAEGKSVQAVLQIIAERHDGEATALATWAKRLSEELNGIKEEARAEIRTIEETYAKYKVVKTLVDEDGYHFDRCTVNEEKMALVFRNALESVRDVFGKEKMTEAVIVQAIISAGYAAWRVAPEQITNDKTYKRV